VLEDLSWLGIQWDEGESPCRCRPPPPARVPAGVGALQAMAARQPHCDGARRAHSRRRRGAVPAVGAAGGVPAVCGRAGGQGARVPLLLHRRGAGGHEARRGGQEPAAHLPRPVGARGRGRGRGHAGHGAPGRRAGMRAGCRARRHAVQGVCRGRCRTWGGMPARSVGERYELRLASAWALPTARPSRQHVARRQSAGCLSRCGLRSRASGAAGRAALLPFPRAGQPGGGGGRRGPGRRALQHQRRGRLCRHAQQRPARVQLLRGRGRRADAHQPRHPRGGAPAQHAAAGGPRPPAAARPTCTRTGAR